jgi:hypothetical protein
MKGPRYQRGLFYLQERFSNRDRVALQEALLKLYYR